MLLDVEADVYWCLARLVEGIQDHYTPSQPGIQKMIHRLRELVHRIDEPLVMHLEAAGAEFHTFAFRWMNCLLLRELPLRLMVRLWDTYLAEARNSIGDGFNARVASQRGARGERASPRRLGEPAHPPRCAAPPLYFPPQVSRLRLRAAAAQVLGAPEENGVRGTHDLPQGAADEGLGGERRRGALVAGFRLAHCVRWLAGEPEVRGGYFGVKSQLRAATPLACP